jgi:uncharacterized sporulation protein YeaH/YhbH (DUF444 family)
MRQIKGRGNDSAQSGRAADADVMRRNSSARAAMNRFRRRGALINPLSVSAAQSMSASLRKRRSDLLRRRVAMRNCGHRVKNNVARVSFVLVDAKHKQVSSRHTGGNQ